LLLSCTWIFDSSQYSCRVSKPLSPSGNDVKFKSFPCRSISSSSGSSQNLGNSPSSYLSREVPFLTWPQQEWDDKPWGYLISGTEAYVQDLPPNFFILGKFPRFRELPEFLFPMCLSTKNDPCSDGQAWSNALVVERVHPRQTSPPDLLCVCVSQFKPLCVKAFCHLPLFCWGRSAPRI